MRYPKAKRSYGQNFLVHKPTLETIAELAAKLDERRIIELGTGTGNLTRQLARRIERVISFELDPEMLEWLEKEADLPENVEVRRADILEVDFASLHAELGGGPLSVVGNLPYNISTQMVFRLVESAEFLKGALLMFQKEVAERITARPGGKDYGILSVVSQYRADVKRLFDLPPTLFTPRPKVTSSLVEFRFRQRPAMSCDETWLLRVVKAAFSQRRKKLVNTLSAGLGFEKGRVKSAIQAAGLDPDQRAEQLSVADFIKLSNRLSIHRKGS